MSCTALFFKLTFIRQGNSNRMFTGHVAAVTCSSRSEAGPPCLLHSLSKQTIFESTCKVKARCKRQRDWDVGSSL